MAGLDVIFEVFEDEDLAIRSFEEEKIISEIQKKNLRRRFKRLPIEFDIEFKFPRESLYYQGKVLNISAVGLLVFTEKIYALGDILNIKLNLLPKPGIIELKGRVVWLVQKEIQPQIYPGMGLEFYNTDTSTQKSIVEFVERNLPLGSMSESQ
jgi:Tfp pilus assembly protein PilZ